jgi:hypothetical protein
LQWLSALGMLRIVVPGHGFFVELVGFFVHHLISSIWMCDRINDIHDADRPCRHQERQCSLLRIV